MGAVNVGPFAFSIHAALIVVAVLVSMVVASRAGRRRGIDVEPAIWKILVVGALAGRLAFVLAYFDIYKNSLWSILDIRDGGFIASVGIVVALAMAAWLAWRKQSERRLLLISLLAGASVWGLGAGAALALHSGTQDLPQVTLARLDGRTVQLQSLAGKPMVVNLCSSDLLRVLDDVRRRQVIGQVLKGRQVDQQQRPCGEHEQRGAGVTRPELSGMQRLSP